MEQLIPLFWPSSDVCPEFQSQGGFPRLRALSSACNGFHRFTSSATPADLLAASIYWLNDSFPILFERFERCCIILDFN